MAITKYWPVAVMGVLIVGVSIFFLFSNTTPKLAMRTINVDNVFFQVEVADTENSRELGLSKRGSLAAGHGMLFVFDKPASWGIWMKDMNFPLDIMWAREDGTIITIVPNVQPSTYPGVLYPQTPDAKYVIEVNAGAAKGIAEGSKMVVQ